MSEYLSAAASAMGLPEALVERSAEARAAETGASIDEVLQAWAGGEEVAAAAPAAEEAAAEETTPAEEAAAAGEETVEEEEPSAVEPAAAVVEAAPEEAPAPVSAGRAPVPDEVTPGEAARLPEVITVPTAGIKERTNFSIPKWLTAVLLIAPLFALFALGGSATGQCGEATELTIDVVTGQIVNCDGSEFTGEAAGGGGADFISIGSDIYQGAAVTGVNCASCHGANGQGGAAFPALTGVINTFGSCSDHIEWITLGSAGFQAEGRTTYGDTAKPVNGGMPAFAANLSEEQLAAVSAFERVRFGGEDPDTALADCGLVEEGEGAPEEGEGAPEDGDEAPEEGGGENGQGEEGDPGSEDEGAVEASGTP